MIRYEIMRILLLVFLIVMISFLPITYAAENDNVTKHDILQLQNEVSDVKSIVESIDNKLTTLDKSLQKAFAVTWGISNIQLFISILSGGIIAVIVMAISHLISHYVNQNTVKRFLRHDFDDVNERIVILITNLRNTLNEIGLNSVIVDSLINRTENPRVFMRRFLVGLLFFRWNAILTKMNSLKHDQVEMISKLQSYITKTDVLPQLDITLVSDTINIILDSNITEQEKRDQISEALRIDITMRLEHYDRIFHTMRDELAPIKWINLSDEHFK